MAKRGNIGMAALMDAARLTKPPTASDMGFALGPRINAGGRVGKSDLGVRLLTTGDPQEAADIAVELNRLNEERRAIEAAVLDEAIEASVACGNAPVAIVAGEGWHPGVIGIVAGRLKEKLHRPAIVIAIDDDGTGKGSGRSISGVDLGAAILAAKEMGLLVAGGGHAMAAGLTVAKDRIDALGAFLNERLAADVARLTGFNRALVTQGLKVMAKRGNIGMAALMDAARLTKPPTASDMGFALGPRINAGGRVGKSDLGVRLLTTGDPQEAADIAVELNRLNEERRAIEAAVLDEAIEASVACANAPVAIVAGDGWHPGVIGIVAGRLKEKLHRPAIVIAIDEDGTGKGSGRSISGVDLGAAILAAKEMGLLVAGGGHAMAAGLTVEKDKIDALGAFLNERLAADVERASGDKALLIDAVLAPRGINPLWCEAIESAGPYGAGWPAPRVATGPVRIVESGIVGTDHVRLIVSGDDGARFKAIAFRSAETELGQALLHARGRKLWLAGRAKRDDWGSRPAAELHLEDAAWAD